MDFEDVLKQVGDFGKFQKYLVILFLMPTSAINIIYDYMFMMSTPDHWCYVPQLANLSSELQHQLIRPLTSVQGLPSNDSCRMYDINYDLVYNTTSLPFNDSSLLKTKECDNGWVYDTSVFQETATTKVWTFYFE
jgi:OCT family organic cation transporter-like MFS transporter 4/5